jgi:hypothetical protein
MMSVYHTSPLISGNTSYFCVLNFGVFHAHVHNYTYTNITCSQLTIPAGIHFILASRTSYKNEHLITGTLQQFFIQTDIASLS